MLTGVTKFSQVSVFSGFNQPADISMDPKFDAICGITEKELTEHFAESIALISKKYGLSFADSLAMLKSQYDGYHFSDSMLDIYNPFSLLNAFDQNTIRNYWYESGTPTFLVKLIDRNNVNIKELINKEYRPEYFTNYKADKADPLAMFYQSGYLTIKKANLKTQRFTLDFPNKEVKEGFIDLLASCATGNAQDQIEAQGYAEPYLNDSRKITKLAINFSSEKRNIIDWSVK